MSWGPGDPGARGQSCLLVLPFATFPPASLDLLSLSPPLQERGTRASFSLAASSCGHQWRQRLVVSGTISTRNISDSSSSPISSLSPPSTKINGVSLVAS